MSEQNKKVRKVFLDELPRFFRAEKKCINWKLCIGYRVRFIYEDIEGWMEIVSYTCKSRRLGIKYLDNPIFDMSADGFVNCEIGYLLKKFSKEFKYEIGQVLKDCHKDIEIIDRAYSTIIRKGGIIENRKFYRFKCNICGFDCGEHYKNQELKEGHWITEYNMNNGGCACCNNKVVVEEINDIPTTAPWMVKYFQGGYDEAKMYTKNSGQRITPICPDCGRIKDKNGTIDHINKTKSIGCSCSDKVPYPEKFMLSVLEQLKLGFKTQFSPSWCNYVDLNNKIKVGFYDFKLDSYPIIIETDGGWHNKDNIMSGQTKEESRHIDNYKDRLANDNGYEVIRIDCEKSELEYIKQNILQSNLSQLFDLSKIDWVKCEEFALSNRVKEACDYKKHNPNMTTIQIGEIMNLNRSTIGKYLNIGNKLNWCSYDAKEDKRKQQQKVGKANGKQIEIFKDGISLGIFPSCCELERQSEKLFSVKLMISAISLVCNGKRKSHGGFTFKYIENKKEGSC